jgi:putative membrane protein
MVTAKHPLTADEQARLHAAVAAVERRTSARFALAIVPVSDRYLLYPVLWGAAAGLLAVGGLALLRPDLAIGSGFLVDAAVFGALALALDWLPLRLAVVPRRIKHYHASLFARREFAARILANAEHRNGVLLFVSLGEHYVEIVADRDIHALVAAGTWEGIVADFAAAVKAGRLAQGFLAAVEACGAVLETHYPPAR